MLDIVEDSRLLSTNQSPVLAHFCLMLSNWLPSLILSCPLITYSNAVGQIVEPLGGRDLIRKICCSTGGGSLCVNSLVLLSPWFILSCEEVNIQLPLPHPCLLPAAMPSCHNGLFSLWKLKAKENLSSTS